MATKVCFTSEANRSAFKKAHPEVQYVGDIEYLDYTKTPSVPYSWCTHYNGMLVGTSGPPATAQPPPSPTIAKPYMPPVTPAPAVTEATPQFWVGKGYTQAQATKIAEWVDKNKMTPTQTTINSIIGIMTAPVAPTAAPVITPIITPVPTVTPAPPQETALRKAWTDLQQNFDFVKAFGLLPSATIESFSRVFSGWSYIDDKAADPRPGDYVAVGLILAGAALLSVVGGYNAIAALPGVGSGGMMKGMASVSNEITSRPVGEDLVGWLLKSPAWKSSGEAVVAVTKVTAAPAGRTMTTIAKTIVTSPWFYLITGASFVFSSFWNLTDPNWWYGVWVKMSGDVKARFNSQRIDVQTKLKQAYNLVHISPTAATKTEALSLLRVTKPMIEEMFTLLGGKEIADEIRTKYPEFEGAVNAFAVQYNDLVKLANGTRADYISSEKLTYVKPELLPALPEDVVINNVKVMDGDTIEWPGHPEYNSSVRFAGMDAHEGGTTSGKAEADYLRSLVEGKTVTIKINTLEPAELYGRLLGVPFLDGVNVVHLMLAKFGKDILGTKYKHKFVDWNENTAIAKGTVTPTAPAGMVPPVEIKPIFKIYIDSVPTRAKLYIDGVYVKHYTPSDEVELKKELGMLAPGPHVIRADRKGWAKEQSVEIVAGDNGKIILTLEQVGLPA